MDKLIDFLTAIGLEVPIIAIATIILTGVIKMPIKALADKTNCPQKITRYITFLPAILGFGLTVLFTFVDCGIVDFTDRFYNTWLSAVSLSLAIYAILEKFVPSEKKILTEAEVEANKAVVKEVTKKLVDNQQCCEENAFEATQEIQNHRKIILTNNKKSN